ncbi:MAG TPA: cupin domain-containing protein [Solirubrobacterales bacterium]
MAAGDDIIKIIQPGGGGEETTPHIMREAMFTNENVWAGVTRAAPQDSGWHHHGGMDTYVYVIEGNGVVEFGPGGKQKAEVTEGSVVFIPKGVVHRDRNPGPGELVGFLVRVGEGPDVVNFPGPDPEEGE